MVYGRTEEACRMIKSLLRLIFRNLLATIYEKIIAPLEKILGAPLTRDAVATASRSVLDVESIASCTAADTTALEW